MHHHCMNTTPPAAVEPPRPHRSLNTPTYQVRASIPGTRPENIYNPNHHTNA